MHVIHRVVIVSALRKHDVSVFALLIALFLLYFVYWWLMSVNLKAYCIHLAQTVTCHKHDGNIWCALSWSL